MRGTEEAQTRKRNGREGTQCELARRCPYITVSCAVKFDNKLLILLE